MASGGNDQRTSRTRHALMSAFIEVLFERGYEGLTVADIVNRAKVGRSTFYEHYDGKDDILQQSLKGPFSTLANIVVGEQREPVISILRHFRDRKKLGGALLTPPTHSVLVRCLAELIESRLPVSSRTRAQAAPAIPRSLIARQVAQAQLTLVESWAMGKSSCKPEAIADALLATTRAIVLALYPCDSSHPKGGAPASSVFEADTSRDYGRAYSKTNAAHSADATASQRSKPHPEDKTQVT